VPVAALGTSIVQAGPVWPDEEEKFRSVKFPSGVLTTYISPFPGIVRGEGKSVEPVNSEKYCLTSTSVAPENIFAFPVFGTSMSERSPI